MKNLFNYDFLDKNKGISSGIIGTVFCLNASITKKIIQSIDIVPLIVVYTVLLILLLVGLSLFDKLLSRQNFSDKQLSLFNKIGCVIYIIGFLVAVYMIFWQD